MSKKASEQLADLIVNMNKDESQFPSMGEVMITQAITELRESVDMLGEALVYQNRLKERVDGK